MSLIDFPLPFLKKECQRLFYAYVACFLGSAGRPQKTELPIPHPSRILTLPLISLNTIFHKSRHTKEMRNSAVTSSKYCFCLEAFPYRTNFVQTCILCPKNTLKVFVLYFKTSWTPFFPRLHFTTIYLYESNLHQNLSINNTTDYWKILSCFNIWLRITREIIEA